MPTWLVARAHAHSGRSFKNPDRPSRRQKLARGRDEAGTRLQDRFRLSDASNFLNDVTGGNPEALDELFGLSAARDLANGQTADREAGVGHGFGHRVADAAGGIVVLDRDQASAGRARRGGERVAIDRRDRVEIDDPDQRASACSARRRP